MKLLITKITGEHASALAAFVDTYKDTASDRKAKIVAMSELAAYVNAHYLASDLVCISCPAAEKIMEAAFAHFQQIALQTAKKNKRGADKDTTIESEPLA